MFIYVCIHFSQQMSVLVTVCICMYISVYVCICLYLHVSHAFIQFRSTPLLLWCPEVGSTPGSRGGFYTRFHQPTAKSCYLHSAESAHSIPPEGHWGTGASGQCVGVQFHVGHAVVTQPSSFFLLEDWNHAHNQPASRIGTHIVLQAAERHCESGVQSHSLHQTSKYNINMYKYIHLQTHTYTYAHSYLAIFSLSTNNTCRYIHKQANTI